MAKDDSDEQRQGDSYSELKLAMRTLFGFVQAMVRYIAALFVPTWIITGSFTWPRGWEAIVGVALTYGVIGVWLWINDLGLLRQRLTPLHTVGSKDLVATYLIAILILAFPAAISVDVHALRLLPKPLASVSFAVGLFCYLIGTSIVFWNFRTNSFAAPIVCLQKDRGQIVIDTRPYAMLRHPMYAGILVTLVGVAVFLESIATLALIPTVALGFLPRILIEERTLAAELPGYTDYLDRVRWRLLPGIFYGPQRKCRGSFARNPYTGPIRRL